MINDILEATKKAKEILSEISFMPAALRNAENLLPVLRQACICKLMIDEQKEDNIRNLVVLSIKNQDRKAGTLPDAVIRQQVQKYDCHQTSLVTRKKVLLLMFVEKELGIHMSDDEASLIETLQDLAKIVAFRLKEGAKG